jgi:choline dehydrogenase-like flavoprotein
VNWIVEQVAATSQMGTHMDNLYVADASFFGSSTAVNPTLTIIANSLRVADRIADRLGTPLRQPAAA